MEPEGHILVPNWDLGPIFGTYRLDLERAVAIMRVIIVVISIVGRAFATLLNWKKLVRGVIFGTDPIFRTVSSSSSLSFSFDLSSLSFL